MSNTVDLDRLLIKEAAIRQRIDKLIENGKKAAHAKRTQVFYETRISDLKALWTQFCDIDLEITEALHDEEERDKHPYIVNDVYGVTEMKYTEYLVEYTENLKKFPTNLNNVPPPQTPSVVHAPVIHTQDSLLPKIALPKYDGDYDKWQSFHDLYVSLVHNNEKLTPVKKLYYLKSCLTGEAELILRHTPITDNDYEPAWHKVQKRYKNTRILVNHQLQRLTNQPKMQNETAKNIKTFVDTTEECLQQLNSLAIDTSSWNALLIYLLVQKLPYQTLKLWEEKLGSTSELPEYKQFMDFLRERARVLESISDTISSKPTQSKPVPREKVHTLHAVKNNKCPACQGDHFLPNCTKYNSMDVAAKRRVILKSNRCLNCLSGKHMVNKCDNKYRCRKCQRKHHTTICDTSTKKTESHKEEGKGQTSDKIKSNDVTQSSTSKDDGSNATHSLVSVETNQALLATALVKAETGSGKTLVLRCLIDTGSQSNFITEAACKTLQAKIESTSIEVTGINATQSAMSTKKTKLRLHSCIGTATAINEDFYVLKQITQPLPTQAIQQNYWPHISKLHLADPTFGQPGVIDALLGAKVFTQILKKGMKRGPKTAPIALNTTFGWILLGPMAAQGNNHSTTLMATTVERDLVQQLKLFWEQEEVPEIRVLTQEEQECQDIYKKTHTRLQNGKYQVKIPFKQDKIPELGDSRPQVVKRLLALQVQFSKKPELKREYEQCLNEYLTLGHMEKVDRPLPNEPHFYIPHHAVFKESTTTKLRVVFDASARTTNGKSLNEQMLTGPTLQPKLFATLLNWRKYKYAMTADIEKMYRMIDVMPEQRTFQRILWPDPHTGDIQDYQLKTVTFGTTAAPYLAIRTLLQLADDEQGSYPLAAAAARNHFYVDDALTGADTIEEAKTLQRELIAMLRAGGFTLRKWTSNATQLLETIPPEHRELQGPLMFQEDESIKALGIRWFPSQDYFTFRVTLQDKGPITKRRILSEIASLYDPLGWLAPVIVTAKILMQMLWITGLGWDSQISDTIQKQWTTFKSELGHLEQLRIPRWTQYTAHSSIQLHGFCDASLKAYAAVVYLRVETTLGQYATTLLTAKTKVAPIKPTTTPRLELNGAVLLAKLMKETIKDMQLDDVPTFAWTDSTIVLQWIREHPSRWKTYVANRVVLIQDIISCDRWHHISTNQNPADLASRGIAASALVNNKHWWNGPEWLIQKESNWPINEITQDTTNLEAKQTCMHNTLIEEHDNILERYSTYTKLVRVVATVLRFLHNCRHNLDKHTQALTATELRTAECVILKVTQKTMFKEEYADLLKGNDISSKSSLIKLYPFMDENKIIRVGGRLQNASLPYDRKHPIILPYNHHVTRLLIRKTHSETLHGGTTLVLNSLRNRYWPINARRCITSEIHKCIPCFRQRQLHQTQLMGSLPTPRVNVSKPFTAVGMDYGGPVTIKASNLKKAKVQKAYFCIFVCMTTRAIHLEMVSDLTAVAFIAALKRFIARRGLCKDLYSDCGTNFVGAKTIIDKELRDAIKQAQPIANEYLTNQAITWHFNPPAAPHFGGLWEAGVKSVKYHLKRTIGSTICTFEEYHTILTQVEACLNSRPLCRVSNDADDLFVLTPGHFLIGQPLNALPEYTESTTSLAKRWKLLQQLVCQFWKKWTTDYLNQLQQRPKWHLPRTNIKVGDIVLLKNENLPPTVWALGKITQVFPGRDGLIRVVDIKTKNSTFQRPIAKICRLPFETD